MSAALDPVDLTRDLIRCASVTPRDAGALDIVEGTLRGLGFHCTRLPFSDATGERVDNLVASRGSGGRHLMFAGHTDVVPAGDEGDWTVAPFEGVLMDGKVWGRGASDMKGAIAAFLAAIHEADAGGRITLVITGDEEGRAENGTKKLVPWLKEHGFNPDFCLIGEPSSNERLADTIKVGRRGSLSGEIFATGKQGHVAYPHQAVNAADLLTQALARLPRGQIDSGQDPFDPSSLELTYLGAGSGAYNVIPGRAVARFNSRFNTRWTGKKLMAWIEEKLSGLDGIRVEFDLKGEPFHCPPGEALAALNAAVEAVTGHPGRYSTTGGTSDGRFLHELCPVAELGLKSASIHGVDEHADVADIRSLADIYRRFLDGYPGERP